MFLRDMKQLKKLLCGLIDRGGPHWSNYFDYLIQKYTYVTDKDVFVGCILLLVEAGKQVQAKALVRKTIDDVNLRPWVYHLALFLFYPYHLAQHLHRKITS